MKEAQIIATKQKPPVFMDNEAARLAAEDAAKVGKLQVIVVPASSAAAKAPVRAEKSDIAMVMLLMNLLQPST